jgi:hypothetical protein
MTIFSVFGTSVFGTAIWTAFGAALGTALGTALGIKAIPAFPTSPRWL